VEQREQLRSVADEVRRKKAHGILWASIFSRASWLNGSN